MSILQVRELESGYGEVQVLWGVSLSLEQGTLTCLVGANGAGKTCLMRTLVGLERPIGGRVLFEGVDITRLAAHVKAQMGIVMVPEGRQLFDDMTVMENLEMGATPGRGRARFRENLERAFELFPGLTGRAGQRASTLSGGEQQMVAVARAVMAEPKVLLIDELSLGLAPLLVTRLLSSTRRLRDAGVTILLVEQNVSLALEVSDRAYVMSGGRIELEGAPDEIAANERVRSAYLGL